MMNQCLEEKVKDLNFFKNLDVIEPKNPQFQYTDGKYIVLEEVKGNKLNYEKTVKAIKVQLSMVIKLWI